MTVREKDRVRQESKFGGSVSADRYRKAPGFYRAREGGAGEKFGAGLASHSMFGKVAKSRPRKQGGLGSWKQWTSEALGAIAETALPPEPKPASPERRFGTYLRRVFLEPDRQTFDTDASFFLLTNQVQQAFADKRAAQPDALLYSATEALRRASIEPSLDGTAHAASLLQRAAEDTADRRPRHAAVALSVWDALTCTSDPFGTLARRRVLWEAAQMLLSQIISTESEMQLLDRMDEVGLERVPPFEDTVIGALVEPLIDEPLR
jgi:hypothetical protein